MANTQAVALSFKTELMTGFHNFAAVNPARAADTIDAFKAALYYVSGSLGSGTTAYSTTSEGSGAGYTAGGVAVPNATAPVINGTAACWTPSGALAWTGLTLTAFDTCLLYNSSQGNRAVGVYTFGSQTVTAGSFSLTMPANTSGNALLQLS